MSDTRAVKGIRRVAVDIWVGMTDGLRLIGQGDALLGFARGAVVVAVVLACLNW